MKSIWGQLAILLLAALWVTVAAADSVPPQINMNVRTQQYEPGVIKAMVQDDTEVKKVTLFYRKPGESYYNSIEMRSNSDIYYQELDRELGLEGTVEYYLVAMDSSGNEMTQPRLDPEQNPLTAAASGDVDTSATEISLTNPEPGAELETGDEPVMVTFYISEREIDFNTVRFKIDKRDRTREVQFYGNVLMWEPRRPLRDGYHEIEVVARDLNGDYVGPNIWTFQVKSKRQLPLGAEGDVYIGIQNDNRSGDNHSIPLWNNKVDVGMKGQTGFLNWSAGLMLSSEESSFLTSEDIPDRQPINRFYFDGRTRHFRARIGDSNPNYSELSMKGILVRGVNLEFKSSRVQAGFVMGYNKRDLEETVQIVDANVTLDPTDASGNTYIDEAGEQKTLSSSYQRIIQDPVSGKFHVYEFLPGTFKRNVMAVQADVVPVKNKWATWKIGGNFFSAEDDSTSLDYDENENRTFSYNGGEFSTDYKPKKNWVGTVETSLRFWDNRSELTAEFGGTVVTENMFGAIPEDLEDDLPENIDDDMFRFNASTQTSFDKQKLVDDTAEGLKEAIKSVYKLRLTSPIPIPQANTYFKGELYRIPTHYVSLGNPQQKTDIGGAKFDIRTRVLKDQVTLNLGHDSYSDNLDDERLQYAGVDADTGAGTGQKDLTKDTSVTSFSVTARPRYFAEYQPNVSIGYRMYTASNNLDKSIAANDIMDMIDTSTNTLMLSFGGTLPVGLQKHTGTLSITSMDISDDRPLSEYLLNESSNLTLMFNVNSVINPMPLTVNASLGRTDNASYIPLYDDNMNPYSRKEITTGINMLNLSGTYKWFRDKRLSTTAGLGFMSSGNEETGQYEIDNSKASFRLEADYRLTSVMSVGANFRYVNYADNANSLNDYTEPIFGVTFRSAF